MDSVIAVLLGCGIASGLIVAGRGLRPRPPSLNDVLDGLNRKVKVETSEKLSAEDRLGRLGIGVVDRFSFADPVELRSRLRVSDKTVQRFAYEKVLGAVGGFTLPLIYLGGSFFEELPSIPVLLGVLLAIAFGALGFFAPDLILSSESEERRAGFRRALSGYLDVVSILIAGGGGIESALQYAADAGDGWAFAEIRRALASARVRQESPWDALEGLGEELGVLELSDLASSLALSGTQGARIRSSLTAKADTLRSDEQNAIETVAEVKNQKMAVPLACLSLGLFLFIGFGAVQAIGDTPEADVGDITDSTTLTVDLTTGDAPENQ